MDLPAILARTAHRPWDLPRRPWVMLQSWHDLLFAHWPIEPSVMRALVPPQLELDLFERRAWVGVVPFRMSGVRLRGLPAVPGTHAFPELNVRTYVRHRGRAGVYFFSLDAASAVAVRAARAWYRLPYFHADMELQPIRGGISYHSRRTHRGAPPAQLDAEYAPAAQVHRSRPGTLESFLTERYALFTTRGDRVLAGDIHHEPWPLREARATFTTNTMARAAGVELPDEPPLLHYAERLDVVIWAPKRDDG